MILEPYSRDLAGVKFGRLTAIERVGSDKNRNAIWSTRCECSEFKDVLALSLKSGHTKSCGCLAREIAVVRMQSNRPERKAADLAGLVFGDLHVIRRDSTRKRVYWIVACKCGSALFSAIADRLRNCETRRCATCARKLRGNRAVTRI
ncbi:hypothetical protein [Paraburkholderia heleia]|uniref:hypothetical protein n=1 Tax=Paraburkholderia heleia TaxID=634127 RepID=UPI00069352B2|nr:hypothetical protein [Paraburkholderia heleia]